LTTPLSTQWDISELALPDRAILYEFNILGVGVFGKVVSCRLALGDQLPTATAEMDRLEPLFSGFGQQGADPRSFDAAAGMSLHLDRLRLMVPAQGRRLILETTALTGMIVFVLVGIVVSGIPTEVPDCLLSV